MPLIKIDNLTINNILILLFILMYLEYAQFSILHYNRTLHGNRHSLRFSFLNPYKTLCLPVGVQYEEKIVLT